MNQINYYPLFARLANAGKWLFWGVLLYTAHAICLYVVMNSVIRMNPIAQSTAWGRFRWHFPALFDLACLCLTLFGFFAFQSKLRRGVETSDEGLVNAGLNRLIGWLVLLVVIVVAQVVFRVLIRPNW